MPTWKEVKRGISYILFSFWLAVVLGVLAHGYWDLFLLGWKVFR